ncbi:AIPR family protein [Bradyrhizobium sp. 151]|uniref:AIPR family protein n=1 Tax=Bradyrhizobium sp. 151 TaxID=2782626 RepID=UPI001FF96648|nr:AIPR family protein [Bradyrhizobium sp. 151]MCK1656742.1 AIPR family protein [Bradyrhizobium sp. 151]
MTTVASEGIRKELAELGRAHPGLASGKDNLFVLWFLKAYVAGEADNNIAASVVGASKDGGFDAIYIDSGARIVHLVQGKYRASFGSKAEPPSDIDRFVMDSESLYSGDSSRLNDLLDRVNPTTREKLRYARNRLVSHDYQPRLYYLTTGKVSADKRRRFGRSTRSRILEIIDATDLARIYRDYADGIAPPIPVTSLAIEPSSPTIIERPDAKSKIRSWIFPAEIRSVATLYKQCGTRLFAKNIRGYLGESKINKEMSKTLTKHSSRFFYLNNGITIICSRAEYIKGDTSALQMWDAQVINGQQTVRTIAEHSTTSEAAVLVKVMQVPEFDYPGFVSEVVGATNFQNAIKASDLYANDAEQIRIQRELHKLGYQYIRKRQSKSEARREGGQNAKQVKREELAQAVGACALDPREVRSGVEHLFEAHYKTIFNGAEAHLYLVKWWLRRAATSQARGNANNGYAKWLAVSAMWGHLEKILNTRERRRAFVGECPSQDSRSWNALCRAFDKLYIVAYQFYQAAKKKRPAQEQLDISRFYRDSKDLHVQFERHWRSSANKQRSQFKKQTALISKELRRLVE